MGSVAKKGASQKASDSVAKSYRVNYKKNRQKRSTVIIQNRPR